MESAITIISSSPIRAETPRHVHLWSSSPSGNLPSPASVLRKEPTALKCGSRMMSPPNGTVIGFTSARHLLQEAGKPDARANEPLPVPKKAPRKRQTTDTNIISGKLTKPTKSRTRKNDVGVEAEALPMDHNVSTGIGMEPKEQVENTDANPAIQVANQPQTEESGINSSPHEGKSTGKRKRVPKPKAPTTKEARPCKKAAKVTSGDHAVTPAAPAENISVKRPRASRKKKTSAEAEQDVPPIVSEASVTAVLDEVGTASHHFVASAGPDRGLPVDDTPTIDLPAQASMTVAANATLSSANPSAPTRRRSWTPVVGDLPPSNQMAMEDRDDDKDAESPDRAFSSLIGEYAYGTSETVSVKGKHAAQKTKVSTRKKKVDGAEGVPKSRKRTSKPKDDKEKEKATKAKTVAVKKFKAPKQPKLKNVTDYALREYRQAAADAADSPAGELTKYLQQSPSGPLSMHKTDSAGANLLEPDITRHPIGQVEARFPLPVQACHKMAEQDFVFGTSSQLARDESPTLLRHTQQAIQESEEAAYHSQGPSQNGSPTTSRWEVVSAPHGTSLSLGPSVRGLWSVSGRNEDQQMFLGTDVDLSADTDAPRLPEDKASETAEEDRQDSGFVDISELDGKTTIQEDVLLMASQHAPPVDLTDLVDSPIVTTITRPVLQTIDVNVTPSKPASAPGTKPGSHVELLDAQLPVSRAAQADCIQSPLKRARGRPRKEPIETSVEPPKPRGRPKGSKNKVVVPAGSPAIDTKLQTPRTLKLLSSSPYKDIDELDEISDSEAAFTTPSPPRRLASSPPVAPIPLQLSPRPSSTTTIQPTVAKVVSDKNGDYTALFAEITRTVKAKPGSSALSKPTWFEKILMYDPIVLEDLTAWLNAEGLRVETIKPKPQGKKPKSKGKAKELDFVDNQGQKVHVVAEDAFETVTEELKPSIVQRWCEQKSICCLWKEGLRGGVRQKY